MTTRRGLIAVALVALPFPALASGDPVAAAIAEVTHGREPTKGGMALAAPPLPRTAGRCR
jgi:hypothetical protein